jgi:hypothetical protein
MPVIFVVISVLVVAFIYSSYLGFEAFAEPADPNWGVEGTCELTPDKETTTCCWTEPDLYNPGETVTWCQTCNFYGDFCGPIHLDSNPTGPFAPLKDGVLEEQPQPSGSTAPPQDDGVLQQPPSKGGGGVQPLTLGPQDSILQQQQQPPAAEEGATGPLPLVTEETGPTIVQEQDEHPPAAEEAATAEEDQEPPLTCPEGLILDEETNLCVLEVQSQADQAEESDKGQQQTDGGGEPEAIEEPQPDEDQSSEENSDK